MSCGVSRDQRNGREIVDHVVRERVDRRIEHVRGERDAEGRACSRRAWRGRRGRCRCVPLAPGTLSMMSGWPRDAAHALGDDARDHVLRPARAGRHDDGDRPRRIGLCAGDARRSPAAAAAPAASRRNCRRGSFRSFFRTSGTAACRRASATSVGALRRAAPCENPRRGAPCSARHASAVTAMRTRISSGVTLNTMRSCASASGPS